MTKMAADRDPPTTTDYVVTALSPVLVMLMVGSLVFFLVEVLYAGKYSGRLLYTLFFFVLGAVLVARIAIETDPSRATLYGVLLGAVSYIALLTYVEYPGGGWLKSFGWLVNLGLMLLIWWSAHKLTWDCTHIDEKQKGADRGVLSAAGLDADAHEKSPAPASSKPKSQEAVATKPSANGRMKAKKPHSDSRLWDWIERYKMHRDARRKGPHTPGVWVIYFALAALPLFALGQSLVDPADEARRRATFLQMAVYIASALGLLVTTSLLGLRRYLRQRKAKIPPVLAGGWLGLGAVLILLFVVVAALLPRPHSELPWFGITRAGKADREVSKYAIRKDGAGKGEGASGDKSKAGDGKASGKGGKAGGGSRGEKGDGKGDRGKGGSGKKGDQSGGDEKGGGKGQGDDSQAKKDEQGSKGEERDGGSSDENEKNQDGDSEGRAAGSQSDSQLTGALEKVAGVVRWIVIAVMAVVVVVVVVLAVLRYLAPFTGWAQRLLDSLKNWWAGLWGKRKVGPELQRWKEEQLAGHERPPSFHAYSNPFTDGSAERRDPADLVAYTFEALDSWAWDQSAGREAPETPLEFLARLADLHPDLLDVLTRFARIYARVSYSDADAPPDTVPACEALWDGMVHGVAITT